MDTVKILASYVLTRAQEPSTVLGVITAGLGVLHLQASADFASALVGLVMAGAGVVAAVMKDGGNVWHTIPAAPAASPAPAPVAAPWGG